MSVADALQLMLAFGAFIVVLLALIVELIKNQQKNNRLSCDKLAVILNRLKLCHRLTRLYRWL